MTLLRMFEPASRSARSSGAIRSSGKGSRSTASSCSAEPWLVMNSSSTSSSVFILAATASIAVSRLLRLASGIEPFGELLLDVLDLVAEDIFAAVAGECDEVQIHFSRGARRQIRDCL